MTILPQKRRETRGSPEQDGRQTHREAMEEDVVSSNDTKTLADLGACLVEKTAGDTAELLTTLVQPRRSASASVEGQAQDLGAGIDGDLVVGEH